MDTTLLLVIIWTHYVADFILQSHRVATNKSKDNFILFEHIIIYSFPFLVLFGFWFALINGIAHFITDWISSRVNSYYYAKKNMHAFFVSVGADQAVHITTLVLTFWWLQPQFIFGS